MTVRLPSTSSNAAPVATRRAFDQRGSAVAWILGLLLVAGIGFAIWYFVLRAPGAESSALAGRVIPAESDVIGGLDLAAVLQSSDLRKLAEGGGVDFAAIEKKLGETGVKLSDLRAVAFGATMDGALPKDVVVALEAKTDAQAAVALLKMLIASAPAQIAERIDPNAIQALEGGVFLIGTGDLLAKATALGKGGAQGAGKAELDLVRAALDKGATAWMAAPLPADSLGGLSGSMAKGMLGGMPTHFGVSVSLGSSVEFTAAIHIPGGDADSITGALKMGLGLAKGKLPAAQKALLDGLELGGKGPVVTARLSLSQSTLADLIKQAN